MKFKFIKMNIAAFMLLASSFSFAQQSTESDRLTNVLATLDVNTSSVGRSSLIRNPSRKIEGTVHLFDNWTNNGMVVSTSDKKVKLRNINFNVQRNALESKINSDSIFTFNLANLSKVVINNRTFKQVFFPIKNGTRVLEEIAAADSFAIYKDYTIDIKEGNPNPMRGAQNDKFITRDQYYVQIGDTFKKFKVKKSSFLKLMGDKADEMAAFTKKNKLSFKDQADLIIIMNHYNSL